MKKNSFGTFVTFAIIIVGAAIYFSWQMVIPKYKANKAALAQTNAEINSARSKLDSLKTAQASMASLGDLISGAFVSMPKDSDTPNLITELEAIATKSQTYIPSIQISDSSSVSPDAAVAATPGNTVLITFSVNGSFENLNTFLAGIENDIRFMNVKSLSMSSSDDKVALALQIESFKRESSSLAAEAAPAAMAPSTTSPGGE